MPARRSTGDPSSLLTLVRCRQVWGPAPTGADTLLLAGGKVAFVGRDLRPPEGWPVTVVEEVDADAVPGFIDGHVHLTGGGGEGGFATRCPEMTLEQITAAGVTTVVGLLGTDDVTRHPDSLLAKVRALEAQGISAYMYVGAYAVPPVTLTGSVKRDLVLIDEVVGVGEIAISDHRSSQPTMEELKRLVALARVGGMLSGKRGIVHFHVGDGKEGLRPLLRIAEETEIPIGQMVPTHVNRNGRLLDQAVTYALRGGTVDVTAFEFPSGESVSAPEAILYMVGKGVPWSRITLSSDSNGSLPEFDPSGRLVGMRVASIDALFADWKRLASSPGVSLEDALGVVGANVARVLGLEGKGGIAPGMDADFLLLNPDRTIRQVWARGRPLRGNLPPAATGSQSPARGR
ncbi:MAG: beta-aspartyl-peptidase [Limnochordaceae bacterium]|nr:beta-aspartyl-peptidase [Limnochordaceae bacterium]